MPQEPRPGYGLSADALNSPSVLMCLHALESGAFADPVTAFVAAVNDLAAQNAALSRRVYELTARRPPPIPARIYLTNPPQFGPPLTPVGETPHRLADEAAGSWVPAHAPMWWVGGPDDPATADTPAVVGPESPR